jgi:hypothetical protein
MKTTQEELAKKAKEEKEAEERKEELAKRIKEEHK